MIDDCAEKGRTPREAAAGSRSELFPDSPVHQHCRAEAELLPAIARPPGLASLDATVRRQGSVARARNSRRALAPADNGPRRSPDLPPLPIDSQARSALKVAGIELDPLLKMKSRFSGAPLTIESQPQPVMSLGIVGIDRQCFFKPGCASGNCPAMPAPSLPI